MIHDVALPGTTTLVFRRPGQEIPVLTAEAVYLDMMLASAQASSRRSKANEDDRLWWLPTFTRLVNDKYQLDLTQTEAWVVARSTFIITDSLKKTFESIAMSLQPTGSTPSSSQPNSSKDSTSASPGSMPSENCKTEYEASPSTPNASTISS